MERERAVNIDVDHIVVRGDLAVPPASHAAVVFAHGSGSGRLSPRNRQVAEHLQDEGLGTLLLDLLTEEEEQADASTGHVRFDIGLLADRLVRAVDWLDERPGLGIVNVGLFGASTGAAAALVAAVRRRDRIGAIVSRGGRPDLAADALPMVAAPTLLVVGGQDEVVIGLNRDAADRLRCEHRLDIVPGATHLFEEPGALEHVATLAANWFRSHLPVGARG